MITPIRTVAAAAVALVAAAAIPALTGAQSSGAREITVREKVRAATFVHHGNAKGPRLATGDRILTRQALTTPDGASVGTLFTDCANVGAPAQVFKAMLQCTSTYRFRDGQVVSAGVVRFGESGTTGFSIVGGSGAYRGARGEITAGATVDGYDGVDVLHLDG